MSQQQESQSREPLSEPVNPLQHWWSNPLNHFQLPLTLVFLILGFVLASQVRTQQIIRKSAAENRVDVLASRLQDARDQLDQMKKEVATLREKVTEYEEAASQRDSLNEKMNEELQESKVTAGLAPVRGPGIRVQLEDSPQRAATPEEQEAYLVHDIDILQLVNELKAAGAEAISINGQRVVAMSEIRCAGPTIKVNGTTVASPFVVNSIGDPDTLKSALELRMGILETLQALKIRVKVTKKDVITVPAVQTGQRFRFAKPIPQTTPSEGGSHR